jgi:hypothetical protein
MKGIEELGFRNLTPIQAEALKRVGVWKTKKPHWTQTPEGKKKMAARKSQGKAK